MEIKTNNELLCLVAQAGLYEVFDPEIGLNVVDLGLIYQIDFNKDDKTIQTIMTLTTQFCPMGESIQSDVNQSLQNAFKDYIVNVRLSFDPPWSQKNISPEGQEFLNQ